MKTFNDLEFTAHQLGGLIARMNFDNGWGVSVVQTSFSYGGREGLYELGVLKNNSLHYDNPVADGDVVGYLTKENVTELMEKVQNYTDGSEISDYSSE